MGGLGINYSSTSKALIALCEGREWSGPEELVRAASGVPLQLDVVRSVRVSVELPKALLPAQAAIYSATFDRADESAKGSEWKCEVKDLRVRAIIGLHPHERQMRQWLEVDVGVEGYADGWDHRVFAEHVYDVSVADDVLRDRRRCSRECFKSSARTLLTAVAGQVRVQDDRSPHRRSGAVHPHRFLV